MPNPFEIAKLADATLSSFEEHAQPVVKEALGYLTGRAQQLSSSGRELVAEAFQTKDAIIIKGIADFHKLPPTDRDILTEADMQALREQLQSATPQSLEQARDTLSSISELRPQASEVRTLREVLSRQYWYPTGVAKTALG